jgi:hypothetical protein
MRALKAAVGVALLLAAADGFLLWGRGLATPVGPRPAAGRYLAGPDAPVTPGVRPPAGVYRYRTSGAERVDRFGVVRAYPAETVRVVSWRGGCRWRETVPLLAEHVETYDFCSQGGDARDLAFSTRLRFFLVPGVQQFACAPLGRRRLAGARPGAALRWRCQEGGSVAWNTTTYLGSETVATGLGPARARHLRLVLALSGRSTGAAVRDLWLDRDGLVLKEQRQVALRVRAPFVGVLGYQERASFVLDGRPAAQGGNL